jgi:hypothetical protein
MEAFVEVVILDWRLAVGKNLRKEDYKSDTRLETGCGEGPQKRGLQD